MLQEAKERNHMVFDSIENSRHGSRLSDQRSKEVTDRVRFIPVTLILPPSSPHGH
jgi:hypothetical protein